MHMSKLWIHIVDAYEQTFTLYLAVAKITLRSGMLLAATDCTMHSQNVAVTLKEFQTLIILYREQQTLPTKLCHTVLCQ